MMRSLTWLCTLAAVLLTPVRAALAHGAEMMLGSAAKGSGALGLAYEFTDQIVVTPDLSLGGMTLYTSIFPGFEWLQADDPADALYVLKVGTRFSMQILSIDSGASVVVGGTKLSAAGQSAFVATTTNVAGDHFHPQWELLLPDGVTGAYAVSFRLTTTSHSYKQSPVYTLTITNVAPPTTTPTAAATSTIPPTGSPTPTDTAVPGATPTGTDVATPTATETAAAPPTTTATSTSSPTASATPSATATPQPAARAGDANCDGVVTAGDLPRLVDLMATQSLPSCGADANQDGLLDQHDIDVTVALHFELGLPQR